METPHQILTLPNGLRVVHRYVDSPVAHCGLIINVGSRDENDNEQGMAHFIEHVLFKGTKKRKAYHILSRLEDVGGELNAYTGKEETILHASVLERHLPRAIELLFEIAFQSVMPEKEVNKERDVINDEISSYLDSPSELIFDDFEDLLFSGHPIGRNILGTPESLAEIDRSRLMDWMQKHYSPERMVFSIVGRFDFADVKKWIDKYASDLPTGDPRYHRRPINEYKTTYQFENKETYQTHAIIGNRGYGLHHADLSAMILLNNLLGGPGMNSRLNLNIREKYGFAYNIESFYTPYTDTGTFGVYVGTDKGTIDRSLRLIHRELRLLREKKLGVVQLKKAKQQLLGQIALSQENNASSMIGQGRTLLHYNKIDTFEEIAERIESVTSDAILRVANEAFDPDQLSTLVYKAR
ncbi:M16 family metallopeptidase [Phaeocystidibacter luteus]|uniref:Insulinase family protein n=1 Tax=Phaeocystidibacter luteus TaxID=911197 RepID=A0A6N6RGN7_9FLAO|nr:pitrilysin family protein [Phaeocystidibacter luteus]KAB2810336.1 insulinase family protein [Phaeocystidibacter luteus]